MPETVKGREVFIPPNVTKANFRIANVAAKIRGYIGTLGLADKLRVGQGNVHNSSGYNYDHRNAADLGVNPNSAVGQRVRAWLQANGIPYQAFSQAIGGVSTGPHIHIGFPSSKTASRYPVGTVLEGTAETTATATQGGGTTATATDGSTARRVPGTVPAQLQKFILLAVGLVLISVAISKISKGRNSV